MNNDTRIKELKKEIDIMKDKIEGEIYSRQGYYPEEDMTYYDAPDFIDDLSSQVAEKERELLDLEYHDEKGIRKKEVSQLNYKEGYIIRDSESIEDYLSRKQHAEEISKLISNKKTLSPLTLGIYGRWGEGKSSFLRLIESELNVLNTKIKKDKTAKSQYNKTHIIRFDASEYNDQNKIWFSMLSQIFAKYEEDLGIIAKVKYGYCLLKKSFKENPWSYIINLFIFSLFILWIIIFIKDKSIVEVLKDNTLYSNFFGLFSTIAVAINIVKPILKKMSFLSKPMSEKLISQLKYPEYKNLLGTREEVKDNLDVLINAWTKKRGDKIVIMVDELDRCSEKTIVEFFEALQLFLPVESIIHVISINQEAVCYALANNNLHFFDSEIVSNNEKIIFGQEYLEKYITIPYQLPHQQNYEKYINYLLTDSSESESSNIFSDTEKSIFIKSISEINKYKRITPRELKKIINLLLLSKERMTSVTLKKESEFILRFDEYINWFLFKYFYPETASFIIEYIEINSTYNSLKPFKMIKDFLFLGKDITKIDNAEEASKFFKYLDGIRIEYILLSNKISESLIVKTKTSQ